MGGFLSMRNFQMLPAHSWILYSEAKKRGINLLQYVYIIMEQVDSPFFVCSIRGVMPGHKHVWGSQWCSADRDSLCVQSPIG